MSPTHLRSRRPAALVDTLKLGLSKWKSPHKIDVPSDSVQYALAKAFARGFGPGDSHQHLLALSLASCAKSTTHENLIYSLMAASGQASKNMVVNFMRSPQSETMRSFALNVGTSTTLPSVKRNAMSCQTHWVDALRITGGVNTVDSIQFCVPLLLQSQRWELASRIIASTDWNVKSKKMFLVDACFTSNLRLNRESWEYLHILLQNGHVPSRAPSSLEFTRSMKRLGFSAPNLLSVSSLCRAEVLRTVPSKKAVLLLAVQYFLSIRGLSARDVEALLDVIDPSQIPLSLAERLMEVVEASLNAKQEEWVKRLESSMASNENRNPSETLTGLLDEGSWQVALSHWRSRRCTESFDSTSLSKLFDRTNFAFDWTDTFALYSSPQFDVRSAKAHLLLRMASVFGVEFRRESVALSRVATTEHQVVIQALGSSSWFEALSAASHIRSHMLQTAVIQHATTLSLESDVFPRFLTGSMQTFRKNYWTRPRIKRVLESALVAKMYTEGLEIYATLSAVSFDVDVGVKEVMKQLRRGFLTRTNVAHVSSLLGLKIQQSNWGHAVMLFEKFRTSKHYTSAVGEIYHLVNAVKYSYLGLGKWQAALSVIRPSVASELPRSHKTLLAHSADGKSTALTHKMSVCEQVSTLLGSPTSLPDDRRFRFIRMTSHQRKQIDAVMKRHSSSREWERATELFQALRHNRVDIRDCGTHHVLSSYRRAGHWKQAVNLYQQLTGVRKIPLGAKSTSSALLAVQEAKQWEISLKILTHAAQTQPISPHVAILAIRGLIGAGVHAAALEGAKLVLHLKHPALSDAILNCMVACSRWNDAVQYFSKMLHDGTKPNVESMELALAACVAARRECTALTNSAKGVSSLMEDIFTLSETLLEHVSWVQKVSGFELRISLE